MTSVYRILITACLVIATANASADEVVVIVNIDNQQNLSIQDIKNIYSDNVIEWGNGLIPDR